MSADTDRKCWSCGKTAVREWAYPGDEWKPWCGERPCGPVCHVYGLGVRDIASVSPSQPDRIAQLEAELSRYIESMHDQAAAHERTKAELAAAQRDFEVACNQHDAERASVVAERDAAQADAAAMRNWLWLNHGCPFSALYGDDGEMQCGNCHVDFKRQPVETISRALAARVTLLEAVADIASDAVEHGVVAGDWETRIGNALAALDEKGGTDGE